MLEITKASLTFYFMIQRTNIKNVIFRFLEFIAITELFEIFSHFDQYFNQNWSYFMK